ncbi:pyruvate dehydrogenase complex transcriptional repressor PdhR [Cocleimonas flava]|uniref:GntR family transcriptional regulator n=1 Tax=Cocleimonas flava TaxID=634765 RepID=A0A4R1F7A6_9GAMM|nr:FCD domain-containing protein [Cocleimonas flava]TCJ87868.1 GntR family transcriptional regulator [Cocleimonas flava]
MHKKRIADTIADKLQTLIVEGSLKPGDRLPAERTLAESFGVSRPSLREAIQKLQSRGLLKTRPGGGTTVESSLNPEFVDPLISFFQEHPESRFDVLEVRHSLEGNAAWHAAIRATDEDKENIKACYEKMILLHNGDDPLAEAQSDAEFHLSIVEASHNLVLLHMMRGLFTLLQNSISHNLDKLYTLPRVFEPLSNQHKALMEAVIAGDPEKARQAAQDHLAFVEDSLQEIDKEEVRKTRSLRRLTTLNALQTEPNKNKAQKFSQDQT